MSQHTLEAGFSMTVTPEIGAKVIVTCLEDSTQSTPLRAACTFGPFLARRTFEVSGKAGVVMSTSDLAAALGNVLFISDSAPASAAQATANVNPTGNENGLTYTAREYGIGGNDITVTYRNPGANDASLRVEVVGKSIIVHLATGEAGAITSTAAEILAAIEATNAANELVTVAIMDADGGGSDDGSGVVTAMASTPLEGGAGFGIATAAPGALCIHTGGPALYNNTGTRAVPVWALIIGAATFGTVTSPVNALTSLHLYGAGAPVNYTDGDPAATGENTAPKGAIYSDTTNGFVYRNSGSQAQPTWTKLGDAA